MESTGINWRTLLKPEYGWRILGLVIFYIPNALWFATINDFHQSIVEEFERRGLELAMPVYKSYNVTVEAQT